MIDYVICLLRVSGVFFTNQILDLASSESAEPSGGLNVLTKEIEFSNTSTKRRSREIALYCMRFPHGAALSERLSLKKLKKLGSRKTTWGVAYL